MDNTKLIARAISWLRADDKFPRVDANDIVQELAVALEAAEAELTRRSNVGWKLAENDLYPDAETCAWCDSASAGLAFWQGDDRQHPSCGQDGHGLRFAAAPVSLEAVKAETADRRPHSRACGFRKHEHGTDCNPNCQTCHGRSEANRG